MRNHWKIILPVILSAFLLATGPEKDKILMERVWPNPTPDAERLASFKVHRKLAENSPFRLLKWEFLGPVYPEGRVVDIEPIPGKPFSFLVASASGGVWRTDNNGTTYYPIFEGKPTYTIGDIAVAPSDPDIIFVGTGENNSSRSSYAGIGIYKSTDGGKTWKRLPLDDTHHIGRIIIHPHNPDIVYVAVIGHLYTHDSVRGLYKSTDGGRTWRRVLYISRRAGVIDVAMDPSDPDRLLAAVWERDRRAWNFVESGPDSGLYLSEDGGESWKRITRGFPTGWFVGRVGIAFSPSNPKIVYAVMDNQRLRPLPKKRGKSPSLSVEDLEKMSREEFLALDNSRLQKLLKKYLLPYSAGEIKKWVKSGKLTLAQLLKHINDAQRQLLERRVVGPEVYRSEDGGRTWRKVNRDYLPGVFNTYGYYFGQVRVDPKNPEKVFILGVPLMVSTDGGKTWKRVKAPRVHGDFHAMWIDPENPDRIIVGNDGGVDFSYDGGKTWKNSHVLPITQFYTVEVEQGRVPYRICGGTQDNGVICGTNFRLPYSSPWKLILGGDGAFVRFDPTDRDRIYAEFQFGYIFRIEKRKPKIIRPHLKPWEEPLRFNWQTPFLISHYNPFILYLGANRVMKSYDKGNSWYPISRDLTTNPPQGDVPYGTITALAESYFKPGRLYVGTDDGRVWRTDNDGASWEEIGHGLPKKWVSRLVTSRYREGVVYLSMTGYRDDDFKTYLFRSSDFGKSWASIKSNLPDEPVNVIREIGAGRLVVGTDFGVYFSPNDGKKWYSLSRRLPVAAVYDMKYQRKAHELVVATHGRGVWKLDGLVLEKFDPEKLDREPALVAVRDGLIYGLNAGYDMGSYLLQKPIAYIWAPGKTTAALQIRGQKPRKFSLKKGINPIPLMERAREGQFNFSLKMEGKSLKGKFTVRRLKGDLEVDFSYGD